MYILIIGATGKEIQPSIDFFEKNTTETKKHEIEILLTGVGSVSTTYFLTRKLKDRSPGLVLQAGIAGCFTAKKLGEVFVIREDQFADLGVMEGTQFKNIFDLGLIEKDFAPFHNGSLINPFENLLSLSGLDQVKAITVNEITTNPDRMDWYLQRYAAVVESMEGAAFHYVCLNENIPFLQIRALSNYMGERDKTKWKIPEAIEMLNEKLISLINSI